MVKWKKKKLKLLHLILQLFKTLHCLHGTFHPSPRIFELKSCGKEKPNTETARRGRSSCDYKNNPLISQSSHLQPHYVHHFSPCGVVFGIPRWKSHSIFDMTASTTLGFSLTLHLSFNSSLCSLSLVNSWLWLTSSSHFKSIHGQTFSRVRELFLLWVLKCKRTSCVLVAVSSAPWPLHEVRGQRSVTLFSRAAAICWRRRVSCLFWAAGSSSSDLMIWERQKKETLRNMLHPYKQCVCYCYCN